MIDRMLVLALSTRGCGETVIGLSLADQLAAAGVRTHFVVAPVAVPLLAGSRHEYTVVEPAMRGLVRLILDDVFEQVRPDAVVLADYFTYAGVMARDYRLDPWFVHAYGVPVLPIDIWEWARTGFTVDLANGGELAVDNHLRQLPAVLRPVPIAHPATCDGALPFRLVTAARPSTRAARATRHALGLGDRDRLVLLAASAWQRSDEQWSDAHTRALAAAVPRLLAAYLDRLPGRVRVAVVGHAPPALAALGRVRTVPPGEPARVDELIAAADLVLSLNQGSTTVAKAAVSHTPTLVLVNEHQLVDRAMADAVLGPEPGGPVDTWLRAWFAPRTSVGVRALHPFRVWPLGMHRFLEPVLRDNPYERAMSVAGLFDEKAVAAHLDGLLFDRAWQSDSAEGRAAYRATVAALPPTDAVLEHALALAGPSRER